MSKIVKRERKEKGFTLIEILIVVTILGLLATMVAMNVGGSTEKAKEAVTRSAISSIADALEAFKLDMGEYPWPAEPTEEGVGLLALVNRDDVDLGMSGDQLRTQDDPDVTRWRGPYLKTTKLPDQTRDVPRDGWRRPFIYDGDGEGGFIITSKGAKPDDEADDIIETSN